jgi:hypothetical protein
MRQSFLISSFSVAFAVVVATAAYAALPPGGTFTDDNGNIFEGAIEAIAAQGITTGCNPPANSHFCPSAYVTRGEMAVFLVRAFHYSDSGGGDLFVDDDELFYANAADRLKTAGVTLGCNPPGNNQYCGERRVTRGEMAAFLVRALKLTDSGGGDLFVDDGGSIFEGAIDKLGTAGITQGCNPPTNDRFCPNANVTRGQMAAFLARSLGLSPIIPPPPGSFAPFSITGSGDDVIDFQIPNDMVAIVDFAHDGKSNFIVWSLDDTYSEFDLLVNEIGAYHGRRMVQGGWFVQPEYVRHLEIQADGNWTVTASPMSAAEELTTSLAGSGDNVVVYNGAAPTLTSTHDGSSNFIIWGYQSDGAIAGLVVNEIGAYSGTDLIDSDTAILDITADGNWTLETP